MKPQLGNNKLLSKTALKSHRKHEAKKVAKLKARSNKSPPDLAPTYSCPIELSEILSLSQLPETPRETKNQELKKKLNVTRQVKEQEAARKKIRED